MFAYGLAGVSADKIAETMQIGVGRGAAIVIMVSGVMLAVMAILLLGFRSVRALENSPITESGSENV